MIWLIALWSRISSSPLAMAVLKFAGIALAVFLVLMKVKQDGKEEARLEALEERIKANEIGNKIEDDVRNMPDGAALDELRSQWRRRAR